MLDSLRFGELASARGRHLFTRSVAGIGHYGNCIGVPTVGGEVSFDVRYEERVYDLAKLDHVDFFISYWKPGPIGHTFVSFHFEDADPLKPADEIYIFGFSRGAYTARDLAGVIGAIGGIPKVNEKAEVEKL